MINQSMLDLPGQSILTRASKLRRVMTKSNDLGESIMKKAQKAKGHLFLLTVELQKIPGAMSLEKRKAEYVIAWKQISSAYHVAKQILEGAYKNDFKKRKKLEEKLCWSVTYALDCVEKVDINEASYT
jgi:REP element-mobilizing transposase RayT